MTEYIGIEHEATFAATSAETHERKPDLYYDGKRLPFEDRSIDTILNIQVLEHTPTPGALVIEMARVLKDDGIMIITAPFSFRLTRASRLFPLQSSRAPSALRSRRPDHRIHRATGEPVERARPQDQQLPGDAGCPPRCRRASDGQARARELERRSSPMVDAAGGCADDGGGRARSSRARSRATRSQRSAGVLGRRAPRLEHGAIAVSGAAAKRGPRSGDRHQPHLLPLVRPRAERFELSRAGMAVIHLACCSATRRRKSPDRRTECRQLGSCSARSTAPKGTYCPP